MKRLSFFFCSYVPNGKSEKQKHNCFFSPSPFQTISIGKFTKQSKFLFSKFIFFLSSFSVCLSVCLSVYLSISIHPSIHPSTHAPIFKELFEYQTQAVFLSIFNCCGLSTNLYIHWLKTQAIVYELLYFDVFEGADKRVWQLLKDFKNDKEFHYVTIKSKTLICYFNQNTPVR